MRWGTICFDLDNTLFSHESAFEKAIHYCFENLIITSLESNNLKKEIRFHDWFQVFKYFSDHYWDRFEIGEIDALTYRRMRYIDTMKQLHLPYSENEADRFHERYYEVVAHFSEPFDGLKELMEKLIRSNITVGIITNGTVDTQYEKIERLGLSEMIPNDHIFISEELGWSKPNRNIFDFALQKMKSKGKSLFIGDSWEHDVIGAIDAGWDAIYLNTRRRKPASNHQPISICHTLNDVMDTIFGEKKE